MGEDLRNFLHKCKEAVSLETEVTIVAGNESAALHLSKINGKIYVPIVDGRRDIVALRGEVLHVLSIFNLTLSDLIFIDDICELLCTRSSHLFLVDHNDVCLDWKRRGFKGRVIGIVDHRIGEAQYFAVDTKIIETCASCASLLVVRLDVHHPLLWYPLIWDSINLTHRTTSIDRQAAEILRKITGLDGAETWRELDDASASLPESEIPLNLLLFKDFKLFRDGDDYYGMSTIHIPLTSLDLNELEAAILDLMDMEDTICLIICSSYRSAKQNIINPSYQFKQQLLLHHPSHLRMAKFLNDYEQLQLDRIFESTKFSIWQQGQFSIGRKQLQPIIGRFLNAQ